MGSQGRYNRTIDHNFATFYIIKLRQFSNLDSDRDDGVEHYE